MITANKAMHSTFTLRHFVLRQPIIGSFPGYPLHAMRSDPKIGLVNDHQKAIISQGVAKNYLEPAH
jgi:hypothetical protein